MLDAGVLARLPSAGSVQHSPVLGISLEIIDGPKLRIPDLDVCANIAATS